MQADYEVLRTVIVMSVDETIYKSTEMGSSIHPIFNKGLPPGTIREHRAFVSLLEREGIEVLQVRDLLEDALNHARKEGKLEAWIRQSYPSQADRIMPHLDKVDADAVLQISDGFFYNRGPDGEADPLFLPLSSMYWARDFAISTPRGVIIGNGRHFGRTMENAIARMIFRHATALKAFPVLFDAGEEGVLLDGGDVIVQDEKTLLVGVGQRSDPKAAPLLASKLGMDVIAVSMPPRDKPNGLTRQLLHLDSMFNLVDRDKAVAVPYFLEKAYAAGNPVRGMLSGLARQTDEILAHREGERTGDSRQLRTTLEVLADVGWLTKYEAGTAKPVALDMKLVDYARAQGWTVVFAGGEREDLPAEKHLMERALYELRWQGVNVAQLRPGRVLAYEHNKYTNAALRRAGVEVLAFDGELLSIRNGGPHCLMMPLVRTREPETGTAGRPGPVKR